MLLKVWLVMERVWWSQEVLRAEMHSPALVCVLSLQPKGSRIKVW
jgi:hypothetical protein